MASSLSWSDILEATRSVPSSPSSQDPSSTEASSKTDSSSTWRTSDLDVSDFGPSALDDDISLLKCSRCGKVVLKEAGEFHRKNCKLTQEIFEGRVSPSVMGDDTREDEYSKFSQKSSLGPENSVAAAMLREGKLTKKAEADLRRMQKAEARERRGEFKKKNVHHDVDRQCGVINDKGLPCTRSLTCKTHSMGAKRAVQGRSRDYDVLLFEWQKATNPGFLARVEEKEREQAAAAEAAAAKAERKKNNPDGPDSTDGKGKKRRRRQTGADGEILEGKSDSKKVDEGELNMWELGADEDDMDREIGDLLGSISGQSHLKSLQPPQTPSHSMSTASTPSVSSRPTTHLAAFRAMSASLPQPLARKNFTGIYTSKSKVLRGKGEASRGTNVAPGSTAHAWNLLKGGLAVGRETPEQMAARYAKQASSNVKPALANGDVNGNPQPIGQPRSLLPNLTPQQLQSLAPQQQAAYLKAQQIQQNQMQNQQSLAQAQAQAQAQSQNLGRNVPTSDQSQLFLQAQLQLQQQQQQQQHSLNQVHAQPPNQMQQAILIAQQQQQQQQQHQQQQPQQPIPNPAQAAALQQQMRVALASLTPDQQKAISKMNQQQQREIMSRLLQHPRVAAQAQ